MVSEAKGEGASREILGVSVGMSPPWTGKRELEVVGDSGRVGEWLAVQSK